MIKKLVLREFSVKLSEVAEAHSVVGAGMTGILFIFFLGHLSIQ